jgi:hypothetical protein
MVIAMVLGNSLELSVAPPGLMDGLGREPRAYAPGLMSFAPPALFREYYQG